MRPRWRKVRADLLSGPARTILTVVSLAAGVAAVGTMQLGGQQIAESFGGTFLAANPPSAVLRIEAFGPELVDAAREHSAVGAVETGESLRTFLAGQFALVTGFLLAVAGILAVVAVVGVAGTMTLGVAEQTREIGVLRTIGASGWAVRRLLLWQGLAVAALGWLGAQLRVGCSASQRDGLGHQSGEVVGGGAEESVGQVAQRPRGGDLVPDHRYVRLARV